MTHTVERSQTTSRTPARRRVAMPLVGAVVVLLAGVVFSVAPLTRTKPAPAGPDPVSASLLACKLRLLRELPIAPPADAVFAGVTVTPNSVGYRLAGTVTATNTAGASVRQAWTCATERRGAEWYPWHVALTGTVAGG